MAVLDNHRWQFAQAGKTLIRLSIIDIQYSVVFIQRPVYFDSRYSILCLCIAGFMFVIFYEKKLISGKQMGQRRQQPIIRFLDVSPQSLIQYIRCPVFSLVNGSSCSARAVLRSMEIKLI